MTDTSTKKTLGKHRILMDRVHFPTEAPTDTGLVIFADHEDTEERPRRNTAIHAQEWADMGSPETVTVTIEPGDHLNDEG